MNTLDISNYSRALDPWQVAAIRDMGVSKVIVQAVDPPAAYPPGVTAQQLAELAAGGIGTEAYVYLWFEEDVSTIHSRLDLLAGSSVRRVWLDVEDGEGSTQFTADDCLNKIGDAVSAIAARGFEVGIYTAAWFWGDWLGTEFSYLPLWAAQYDGIPYPGVFNPFGGWSQCEIKQYRGTTQLVIPNVDLNQSRGAPEAPRERMLALLHSAVIAENAGDLRDLGQRDKEVLDDLAEAANAPW